MENIRTSQTPALKKIVSTLGGGLLGAAVGYATVMVAMKLHLSPKSFSWFDSIALWLGIVFVAFGIFVFFLSTNRKRLARKLEGEDADLPATNDEVRTFRLQSGALALAGVMMLIPTFTAGSLAAHPGNNSAIPLVAFAAIVLLFVLQTIANIQLWRLSDEFARRLLLTIAALTFAIGQGLLFLYAAAERLHIVPAITSWDVVTLLLTLYLVVGASVSFRHQR